MSKFQWTAKQIQVIINSYTNGHIPSTKIAQQFNVSPNVIIKFLRDNGVTINCRLSKKKPVDVPEIIRLYAKEHMPSTEIGRIMGVTSPTILNTLRENNIKIMPKHGNPYSKGRIQLSELPSFIHNPKRIGIQLTGEVKCSVCGKSRRLTLTRPRIQDIIKAKFRCRKCAMKEHESKLIDLAVVKHMYEQEHLTVREIAKALNLPMRLIRGHMERYNIPFRKRGITRLLSCQRKIHNKGTIEQPVLGDICRGRDIGLNNNNFYVRIKCASCSGERWEHKSKIHKFLICKPCAMKEAGKLHSGENSVFWQGGISFEPYSPAFNRAMKDYIRKRDNYQCQICGTPQNGVSLAVHHIDYDKKNTYQKNLISLCPSGHGNNCHNRTTHNRAYWQSYLTNIMNRKYALAIIS